METLGDQASDGERGGLDAPRGRGEAIGQPGLG